jgi:isocitrate dehydrogenase kinase/phosphatase
MSEASQTFQDLELPPADRALQQLEFAGSDAAITAIGAEAVLESFDRYYYAFRQIPNLAQQSFEQRNPAQTLRLSQRRLRIYVESIRDLLARIRQVCPRLSESEELWRRVERHYVQQVRGRYEEDLAIAYIHSARRLNYGDEWSPVDYSVGVISQEQKKNDSGIAIAYEGAAKLTPERVLEILEIPSFSVPYRDASGDAQLVAERINQTLGLGVGDGKAFQAIEMIKGGFFRNRGAYLVGRFVWPQCHYQPFVLALECGEDGIFVDAVLTAEAHTHNIFSSTLANFHVTNDHYHELAPARASLHDHRLQSSRQGGRPGRTATGIGRP